MTHRKPIAFLAGAAVALAALAIPASGNGESASAAPQTVHVAKRHPTIKLRKTHLGKILVDSRGRTLYLFKRDRRNKSRCFGACATFWPPLRVTHKPTVGRGLKASKVGTTRRSDGRRQVTYNHHPLYRFSVDKKPGETNGEGLTAFGGRWFVLSRAGRQISR